MRRLKQICMWVLILVLVSGNVYQGWPTVRPWLLEMLGSPEGTPINQNSAEYVRMQMEAMRKRIEEIAEDNQREKQESQAVIKANAESFATYRQLAENQQTQFDVMENKVKEANARTESVATAMKNCIKEMVKQKVLPEYMTTAF